MKARETLKCPINLACHATKTTSISVNMQIRFPLTQQNKSRKNTKQYSWCSISSHNPFLGPTLQYLKIVDIVKAVLSWCTLLRNFWGSCEAKSFSPRCRPSVFFHFWEIERVPKLLSKIQIAFLSSSIFQSFFASWLKMMQSTTQHSV